MNNLEQLAELGQSIWLDYIRREMLDSGELSQLRETGIRGVTSNPAIFEKAITQSDDYDDDLRLLASEGLSPKAIYEGLAIEDIQRAAEEFNSLFRQTEREDGYVSLEVNPRLSYDTEATLEEARRLFALVDRPNVYIKVPGTPEGIPAIEQLISESINVNITLLFSLEAYKAVTEAYLRGLERLAERGGDLSKVNSVASFFISRVDVKVDSALDALGESDLKGQIGIANAKMAYQIFKKTFTSERWERLARQGAHVQRVLWASTSTKDPAYPETLYVDNLIGPYTVNTVPPETLEALIEQGTIEPTLEQNVDVAQANLARLAELGIDMDQVTDELLDEGVDKFENAFNSLLESIAVRRALILREASLWDIYLEEFDADINEIYEDLEEEEVLDRLWKKDYTLWADGPDEITNRLGWLTIASDMQKEARKLRALADTVRKAGITQVVLLGMGGSSLAPDLFARTFGPQPGYPEVQVLDTTDPVAISAVRTSLTPEETLFVVSSKSGGTVETISLFKYFYNWLAGIVGEEKVGEHFIAITDPGSSLAQLGEKYSFRAVFLSDPNIGGRYSALSHFGMVPAALAGLDVAELLERAAAIAGPEDAEQAAWLGVVLGHMADTGRDKVTFISSPEIASFGDWVEQLIAESTGKADLGILPIVGEPLDDPDTYSEDRLFIYLRLAGGTDYDEQVEELIEADFPVIIIHIHDRYDLAEQFVIWQIATAMASHVIGVHPFNQPNVELAKVRAREMLAAYVETGQLPDTAPRLKVGNTAVHELGAPADSIQEALSSFLEQAQTGDYVAVQAYVAPSAEADAALARFRAYLRDKTGLPATVGYGPRFLHSTGQLHKGDAGNGLFIQLTTEPLQDLPIPDEPGSSESSVTFGVLKMAQALGDAQALQAADRRMVRFHYYGNDVPMFISDLMYGA